MKASVLGVTSRFILTFFLSIGAPHMMAAPQPLRLTGALITQTQAGQMLHVLEHNEKEVLAAPIPEWSSLADLIRQIPRTSPTHYPVEQLFIPLKNIATKNLGIGLSYVDHQKEVKSYETVFFEKNAQPNRMQDKILFREYLDYEAEIALLMHRHEPHLFAYFLHNDLTDRKIQTFEYDAKNPAPGFSKSKSFSGANPIAPMMLVGGPELWPHIRIEFYLNGELRQRVNSQKNVLNPTEIHAHVFSKPELSGNADWVLIGTGTPAGTIFYAPSTLQKIEMFILSGFSMNRARMRWLNKFEFLESGDELEFRSKVLGDFRTYVE
jgi:2-keto-4-pentenoate hydratase/2-oxohepta-3-ene-1,7-dioic acid hydratase in catechol pathway